MSWPYPSIGEWSERTLEQFILDLFRKRAKPYSYLEMQLDAGSATRGFRAWGNIAIIEVGQANQDGADTGVTLDTWERNGVAVTAPSVGTPIELLYGQVLEFNVGAFPSGTTRLHLSFTIAEA